jgi:predicted TIM-barrel enzyme
MMTSFIREEYIAYPFCAHDDALDSLSRIADLETGTQMAFPDPVSIEHQIRLQLESRGLQFEDAISAEYEPI